MKLCLSINSVCLAIPQRRNESCLRLKLENEPGWIAAHLRGVDNIGEVAVPLETEAPLELAVPVYQPQGIACLEVVFKTGVPVRESPSRKAKTVATLKCGEYVFAQTQNFDGWLRIHGKPEGWVLANDSDWGELLRRRRRMNDRHGQRVFAHVLEKKSVAGEGWLRELIAGFKLSTRALPLPGIQGEQEEEDFYEEQQAAGIGAYPSYPAASGPEPTIRKGFFNGNGTNGGGTAQLPSPKDWDFSTASSGHGAFDPAFEGTKPFEYKGKVYTMAPNGVLFDPPNQVPMGIWNPDTQRLDPAAGMMPGCPYPAISYLGRTYILLPDQRLLDPETEQIVGTFNHLRWQDFTQQVELHLPGYTEKKRLLDGLKDFLTKVTAVEEKLYMVKAVGKVKGKMEDEDSP
eukprot:g4977.t1